MGHQRLAGTLCVLGGRVGCRLGQQKLGPGAWRWEVEEEAAGVLGAAGWERWMGPRCSLSSHSSLDNVCLASPAAPLPLALRPAGRCCRAAGCGENE